MAGSESRSAELRDVLGRFYALSMRDQMELFAEAREHLGSDVWVTDEAEEEIEKCSKALKALEEVSDDLRDRGEFRKGKSPTVKEFDTAVERLGLDVKSGGVIRAFLRWREAKKALEGGRARETPSRRRARAAAVGRGRTHEDYLHAVRLWLETEPAKETIADYGAFVEEENRKAGGDGRQLPSAEAVTTGLRVGWSEVIRVARREVTLDKIREAREVGLLKGLTDESLVGADIVAALTGIRSQRITERIRKHGFPAPAAKVGTVRAWFLGDVKKVRNGEQVPDRPEYFFQDEIIDLPGLAGSIGRSVDRFRTLLSEEAWDRIPRPDGRASGNWYWLRSNVDVEQWKARKRGGKR